ncbi:MAG: TetR/AcrR family transcriptional regulator [Bacillota bacterium]
MSYRGKAMPSQTYYNLPKEKQERIMQATIHEMGTHTFENLNIANIIRASKISRGSFYQYFSDKYDLYTYFYQYIAQRKIEFFGDLFKIEHDIPFLERFLQLYISGFKFGTQNPEIVKAAKKVLDSDYLLASNQMADSMKQGVEIFASFIKRDQELGRIRRTVDPSLLAAFLLEFSNKMTLEEYFKYEADPSVIENKIRQLIEMLQKGIE